MKSRVVKFVGRSAGLASALLTSTLLLPAPLAAGADTPFTGTGYLVQVPAPGIPVTNSLGQVMLKGNVHVLAVQGSDPRATGRLQAGMDLGYQADGTALFGGQAYFELGTWQNQTNFTPTAGLWVMNYTGVAQADNSDTITMTGYGIGGTIDGWRTETTSTRAAGPFGDPTIPYLSSGVIKPPPVTVTDAIDVSQANTWPLIVLPPGGALFTTNNQLTVHAAWPGTPTVYFSDTVAALNPMIPWSVTPGHTLEARLDVVRVNLPSVHCFIALYNADGQGYWFVRGASFLALGKHLTSGACFFSAAPTPTRKNNEILVLALTPSGNDVVVTGRVLDRDNAGAVICETSALDTPAADPTLTADQAASITGVDLLGIVPDLAGAPWTSGTTPTLMMQQHTDGTLPAAEATFDHLELRTSEIPPIGIGRAVQLSWPNAAGMNYSVESAPSPLGPFLPLNIQVPPGMQQLTVPASQSAKFFRVHLAP